jgi:hypothetical protein
MVYKPSWSRRVRKYIGGLSSHGIHHQGNKQLRMEKTMVVKSF